MTIFANQNERPLTMMPSYIWVMTGGALGALTRFSLYSLIQSVGIASYWGTVTANLSGCLFMGALFAIFEAFELTHPDLFNTSVKLLIITGFLGALTTFSTYGADMFHFVRDKQWLHLLIYLSISNIGGFFVLMGAYNVLGYLLKQKS